jgi:hypothetical protein
MGQSGNGVTGGQFDLPGGKLVLGRDNDYSIV